MHRCKTGMLPTDTALSYLPRMHFSSTDMGRARCAPSRDAPTSNPMSSRHPHKYVCHRQSQRLRSDSASASRCVHIYVMSRAMPHVDRFEITKNPRRSAHEMRVPDTSLRSSCVATARSTSHHCSHAERPARTMGRRPPRRAAGAAAGRSLGRLEHTHCLEVESHRFRCASAVIDHWPGRLIEVRG